MDIASLEALKPSSFSDAGKEQEQCVSVQKVLQSTGMENKRNMMFATWYSLDSPLYSSTNYSLHMDDEEAKQTVNQSHRKLLFDAVNTALLSAITACHGPRNCYVTDVSASEEIWAALRNKLSSEKCVPHNSMSSNAMVDTLVKNEVTGREWIELKFVEVYEFCKDIAEMALIELLEQELPEL